MHECPGWILEPCVLGYDLLMVVVIPGGRPLNPGKKRDSEKDTSALDAGAAV